VWHHGRLLDAVSATLTGDHRSVVYRHARNLELAAAGGDCDRHRVCHGGRRISVSQYDEGRTSDTSDRFTVRS
jgi:hypothetical protein